MTRDCSLPKAEIQALVASGFSGLPNGEYLLLTVNPAQVGAARAWLRELLKFVVSVDAIEQRRELLQRLVTVAVSHAGLQALGLAPAPERPFPPTFVDGMGQVDRARLLGDDARSWRWADCAAPVETEAAKEAAEEQGDQPRQAVHLLVAHYWADAVDGQPCAPLDQASLAEDAWLEVRRVATDRNYFQGKYTVEHFGFLDGISQPRIVGLRASDEGKYRAADGARREALARDRLAAGEFLLGFQNEYREPSYAPGLSGYEGAQPFARAGSYIAVRQIRQNVAAFRAFEAQFAKTAPPRPDGATIGEHMIGRKRDGTPLCPFNPDSREDFGYFTTDLQGYGCPRGAHMRRANPRDSLGHDAEAGEKSARLHRLLRRGRSYTDEQGEQGLFFMALNADLDRQFALIQQRWIANPAFDGLANEGDPLLGQSQRAFTIQDPLLSERVTGLPRFTEVVGGGYFLLPSLPALRFMAQPPAAPI